MNNLKKIISKIKTIQIKKNILRRISNAKLVIQLIKFMKIKIQKIRANKIKLKNYFLPHNNQKKLNKKEAKETKSTVIFIKDLIKKLKK